MIQTLTPNLFKALAIASALMLASTGIGNAQSAPPSAQTPPGASNGSQGDQTGNTTGETTSPQAPKSGSGHSNEDYDSSAEPFGRGCPFQGDSLQLIT